MSDTKKKKVKNIVWRWFRKRFRDALVKKVRAAWGKVEPELLEILEEAEDMKDEAIEFLIDEFRKELVAAGWNLLADLRGKIRKYHGDQ